MEEDDDDDESDSEDELGDVGGGEAELEDLEDQPGPSSAEKRKRVDEDAAEIVEGLSGDEVDPSNIIVGGRKARRGRASSSVAGAPSANKYTAKVQLDSDEDEW